MDDEQRTTHHDHHTIVFKRHSGIGISTNDGGTYFARRERVCSMALINMGLACVKAPLPTLDV